MGNSASCTAKKLSLIKKTEAKKNEKLFFYNSPKFFPLCFFNIYLFKKDSKREQEEGGEREKQAPR